jgi:LCP family protein required for cell wall assembly
MWRMSETNSKTKRPGWLLWAAAIIIILAIASLIAYPRFKQQWSAPLGPGLELPTYTPTIPEPTATKLVEKPTSTAENALAAEVSSPTTAPTATKEPTATVRPTATPKPLCGGPETMIILAVGVDTKDPEYHYGLGDAIRVARIDFVTPKVSVLTIPRDIWVEIPGISDHYGITHGKLNQSYLYGSPGMGYYDGPGSGPGLMARTLDLNLGLRADHYGAVNMLTFERIVDAVGGIDVYLPYDVDGTPTNMRTVDMGYFFAGNNHFTGDEALRFARIRKRYSDFTRQDHQTMVLCALQEKLLSPSVLPKVPEITAAFKDSVITDLSLEQMGQLACLLPKLDGDSLLFTSFPEGTFTPARVYNPQMEDNTFVMDFDMAVVKDYIQQFLAGTWPTPDGEKGTTCP